MIFQDKTITYKEVLEYVISKAKREIIFNEENADIGSLLFQYNETDWQFMKRVAGLKKSILVPIIHENGIRICFGLPRSSVEISLKEDFYASGSYMYNWLYLK